MVEPFSFKHTGMHCLAQSDRLSALSTQAMVTTKQINMAPIVFFDIILVNVSFFCKILKQGSFGIKRIKEV
ncbi:hypothetical protein PHAVU_007G239700 [Phaseolus vulgaris]|uniref:Uncharacterized protein n=1 Tax=Phaseolus vulgaris TaxID=3885 RepID=V7BK79_PHAVU|nr:hypothetical protein PHAVU_007G239700g [Phaseolus vulgaris]ESW17438.1 hypothetical protein PHAVU_007G239700g [Phaseolus vulgaris]